MTQQQIDTARRAWKISCDVADLIYLVNPPDIEHALWVSRLLFMTAAHESDDFKTRRQYGYKSWMSGGAFSLWQVEGATMSDCLGRLNLRRSDDPFYKRVVQYIVGSGLSPNALDLDPLVLLAMLKTEVGDPLGCVLTRLNYLQDSQPIPHTVEGIAEYAKRVHNTVKGKATWDQYRAAYLRWITVVEGVL